MDSYSCWDVCDTEKHTQTKNTVLGFFFFFQKEKKLTLVLAHWTLLMTGSPSGTLSAGYLVRITCPFQGPVRRRTVALRVQGRLFKPPGHRATTKGYPETALVPEMSTHLGVMNGSNLGCVAMSCVSHLTSRTISLFIYKRRFLYLSPTSRFCYGH